MTKPVLYRNIHSRGHLEIFLLSAIASLLLVRFYLHITGYPQIGNGGLHIAHMLWGGLLMLVALTIGLSFLGIRAQRIMALIGGIGFGVFIDELGKFITRDNDYFYRPTIGLIYAVFIVLYLIFNFISRRQHYSSREYQINSLFQLEEAIAQDMDHHEKNRVRALLKKADHHDPLTREIRTLLASIQTIPNPPPGRFHILRTKLDEWYKQFWQSRNSRTFVRIFFIVQTALFTLSVLAIMYNNFDSVRDVFTGSQNYSNGLLIGQLISSAIAGGFAIAGALLLTRSRLSALEQFRRATLINIFLTEFFIFSRDEFGALPGFMFNLLLLGIITYAIRTELHLRDTEEESATV